MLALVLVSLVSFAKPLPVWNISVMSNLTAIDPTEYYWFDANTMEYLYRQSTIEDEMWLTDFNESTYSPRTLREYGYAPNSVTIDEYGYPTPSLPWPDKVLYSHP